MTGDPSGFYVNWWIIILRKKRYHSVWNGVILERLIISQLVKKFSESYATWRSLPCSQESDYLSISWVILTQFTPCNLGSLISNLMYYHSRLVLSSGLLPLPPSKLCIHFYFPLYFCHPPPPPISFSLIGLPEFLFRKNHDALLYTLFSRLILFTVSYPQFSSAPYSRTSLAYVLPLMTNQISHRCKTTG